MDEWEFFGGEPGRRRGAAQGVPLPGEVGLVVVAASGGDLGQGYPVALVAVSAGLLLAPEGFRERSNRAMRAACLGARPYSLVKRVLKCRRL